jgi:hypothetical protein
MEFIRKVKDQPGGRDISHTPVSLAGELYEEVRAEGFQF